MLQCETSDARLPGTTTPHPTVITFIQNSDAQ